MLNNSTIHKDHAPGSSLTEYLQRHGGKLGEKESLYLGRQAAKALTQLHQRGLLYGNLNPGAIQIRGDVAAEDEARVTLLFPDLARPFGVSAAAPTMVDIRIDSPTAPAHYLAPECTSAGTRVDDKADVYALGAVLYHLMSGRPPFEGALAQEIVEAHLVKRPRSLRRRADEITAASEELIDRMLAKSPMQRPSMAVVEREIGQLISALTLGTPQITVVTAAAAALPATIRIAPPALGPPLALTAITPAASVSPAPVEPLRPGGRCGKYRIVRQIAEGGMAEVFEGVNEQTRQRVAIKVLLPALARQPGLVARFLSEVRATNQLRIAGIVEMYDYDQRADGTPYMVMEYVDGETLRARLQRQGRVKPAIAIEQVRQLALTLAAAHARQVIHRDIKPDNVMLVADPLGPLGERTKILDFGIAKLAVEQLHSMALSARTRPGSQLGSLEYMAPEQRNDPSSVDASADVYALGVLAYELLAGRRPFSGEGILARMMMSMQEEVPPPPLPVRVPGGVSRLIGEMLASSPKRRPSMTAIAHRLAPHALTWRSNPAGSWWSRWLSRS